VRRGDRVIVGCLGDPEAACDATHLKPDASIESVSGWTRP
jgi:hypothetical protein